MLPFVSADDASVTVVTGVSASAEDEERCFVMPDYIKICIYDVNTKTESIRHIYFQYDDTAIENYDPHPAIKAAVAV